MKQQILDEFCETTGYCRGYARFVLRNHGARFAWAEKEWSWERCTSGGSGRSPGFITKPLVQELIKLWELVNYSCGKRLVAIMPELIVKLKQFGELRLASTTRVKLLRISAATVDRLLQPERRKQQLRWRSHTKPGTLLKHQIPFARLRSGISKNGEIDLVAHDGGNESALE